MIGKFIIKYLKKTLRKKDFWFSITVYPFLLFVYIYIKNNEAVFRIVEKMGIWYFAAALIISTYIVFIVVFEIAEKRIKHKIQGDKLKIKQEQNWR